MKMASIPSKGMKTMKDRMWSPMKPRLLGVSAWTPMATGRPGLPSGPGASDSTSTCP